jgi:hypothetical protein
MKNGLAVGVKSPALQKGRVFGRQASVNLVWWLSHTGQMFNGSEEVPLIPETKSSCSANETEAFSIWRFRAGDTVYIRVAKSRVSVRVNDSSWSCPVSITPQASPSNGEGSADPGVRTHALRNKPKDTLQLVVQMLDAGDHVDILDHESDSILEGNLSKRANSVFALTAWQNRWFVLKADTLLFREARASPAARMLDLSGIKDVQREGEYSIRVQHETRILRLRAGTPLECDAWLRALNSALSALKHHLRNQPKRPNTAWAGPQSSDQTQTRSANASYDTQVRPFTTSPRSRPPPISVESLDPVAGAVSRASAGDDALHSHHSRAPDAQGGIPHAYDALDAQARAAMSQRREALRGTLRGLHDEDMSTSRFVWLLLCLRPGGWG